METTFSGSIIYYTSQAISYLIKQNGEKHMLSQQWRKSLGVGTAALTGLLLLGVLQIIDIEPSTNLFSTGITISIIFGIGNLLVALAIYKNWI